MVRNQAPMSGLLHFIVVAAFGALCFGPGRISRLGFFNFQDVVGRLLSKDEARRIAVNIA
jgi:hypothetical protein